MNGETKFVLCLCFLPISIAIMVGTIWLLHHGYLSLNHTGTLSSHFGRRAEGRIIVLGLLAPFFAVIAAIIAWAFRNQPPSE